MEAEHVAAAAGETSRLRLALDTPQRALSDDADAESAAIARKLQESQARQEEILRRIASHERRLELSHSWRLEGGAEDSLLLHEREALRTQQQQTVAVAQLRAEERAKAATITELRGQVADRERLQRQLDNAHGACARGRCRTVQPLTLTHCGLAQPS